MRLGGFDPYWIIKAYYMEFSYLIIFKLITKNTKSLLFSCLKTFECVVTTHKYMCDLYSEPLDKTRYYPVPEAEDTTTVSNSYHVIKC